MARAAWRGPLGPDGLARGRPTLGAVALAPPQRILLGLQGQTPQKDRK